MDSRDQPQNTVKHWSDFTDVHDFLEQVRLRPGMWLRAGSLHDLETMLWGYQVALAVHSIDEPFIFGADGAFITWLWQRLGPSPQGWAAAIERTTPAGSTPIEEFFRLLDAYMADTHAVPTPTEDHDLARDLMINTFVTLFWRRELLDETRSKLQRLGYEPITLNAVGWTSEQDLHTAIKAALSFPDYYGNNLNALNDCLDDVACGGRYDDAPEGAGLLLVFTNYDRFVVHCPQEAQTVLDICADSARRAAVLGRRMICLVQTNDPQITFEPIGATTAMWNQAESLDRNRRSD